MDWLPRQRVWAARRAGSGLAGWSPAAAGGVGDSACRPFLQETTMKASCRACGRYRADCPNGTCWRCRVALRAADIRAIRDAIRDARREEEPDRRWHEA